MDNMLKRYSLMACGAAAVLLISSCTQGEDSNSHMEGKLPITLTAIQLQPVGNTPYTRVTETATESKWSDNDKIHVIVQSLSDGNETETDCTLKADGSVSRYSPQLFWQAPGLYNIYAWYSNITGIQTSDNTVDIQDQSEGVAYVMKAEAIRHAYYQDNSGNIRLTFVHQLAKVRVRLTAKSGSTSSLANARVSLRGCYTSCTVNRGTVIPSGKADGYINMMPPAAEGGYFEANVIPDDRNTRRQTYALEITADGKTKAVDLDTPVTLEAGKAYTFNITVG